MSGRRRLEKTFRTMSIIWRRTNRKIITTFFAQVRMSDWEYYLQMTPLNCEATPFINSASPGFSIGLPQVVWDPLLGVWQPCSDEHGSSSANISALTPLSDSSLTNQAKVLKIAEHQLLDCLSVIRIVLDSK